MKKTLKQRALELLTAHGWSEDPKARSSKYTVLTKPGDEDRYYLGSSGAIRKGRTVTSSFSVGTGASGVAALEKRLARKPRSKNENTIRFAVRKPNGCVEPHYGTPTIDGGIIDTDGFRHEPGTWYPSRQADGDGSNEQEAEQRPDPTRQVLQQSFGTGSDGKETSVTKEKDAQAPSSLAKILKNAISHEREKIAAGTIAGWVPTDEQRAILQAAVQTGLRCLVMPAGAGTGKTSTLKMLEEVLPGRGQGTAFNRPLVNENKLKFKKIPWSTTHGLAYGTVGKRFAHRLNSARVRSDQVARRLGITDLEIVVGVGADGKPAGRKLAAAFLAGQVMTAVKRFCQSADERIAREHFKRLDGVDEEKSWTNNDVVRDYLLPFAEKAWADLSSTTGQLPFSHDVYVKLWQLGKGPNKPLIPADYILLDEGQDTAPVFLDVLKQQTHALLIIVGDDNQAIYEWRGAINAMAAFPGAPRKMLSQSFRFGPRIADVANSVLAGLETPTDLVLKGLDSIPSVVAVRDPIDDPRCVLCRTNAAAIATVMDYQRREKKTHLIANVDEVAAFVRAARDLQAGKSTSHPELGCFERWTEVVEYSKTDEGQDLRLWVKLIEEFGCQAILTALEAQTPEADADVVVCTAHKSKGREWETVRLAGDFPPVVKMSDSDRRLLYVAATRAKRVLDVAGCPPFHPYVCKESGERTPGIEVKWTGPMPKLEDALVKEDKPAEQPKPAQQPTNGHAPAKEFQWANYNGKWCVGGPPGHANQVVEVVRRNGTKSQERLGKAVKEFPERSIYEVAKS